MDRSVPVLHGNEVRLWSASNGELIRRWKLREMEAENGETGGQVQYSRQYMDLTPGRWQ